MLEDFDHVGDTAITAPTVGGPRVCLKCDQRCACIPSPSASRLGSRGQKAKCSEGSGSPESWRYKLRLWLGLHDASHTLNLSFSAYMQCGSTDVLVRVPAAAYLIWTHPSCELQLPRAKRRGWDAHGYTSHFTKRFFNQMTRLLLVAAVLPNMIDAHLSHCVAACVAREIIKQSLFFGGLTTIRAAILPPKFAVSKKETCSHEHDTLPLASERSWKISNRL